MIRDGSVIIIGCDWVFVDSWLFGFDINGGRRWWHYLRYIIVEAVDCGADYIVVSVVGDDFDFVVAFFHVVFFERKSAGKFTHGDWDFRERSDKHAFVGIDVEHGVIGFTFNISVVCDWIFIDGWLLGVDVD